MKKAKVLKLISKIALIVTIFAFGVSMVGGMIILENADAVNYAFNVKTQEIVKNESTGADTEYFKSDFNSVKEVKANGEKLLDAVVSEGITLLKNENNVLPLKENAGVSLFSTSSVSPILVGTGSGAYAEASNIISLKQGFENAGLKVNSALWDWYTANLARYGRQQSGGTIGTLFTISDANWSQIATNAKTDSAYGDAAIFVLSRSGGEGVDSTIYGGNTADFGDGNYLKLSPTERDVLKNLKLQKDAGVFKSIIVLMNSANQVECEFVNDPQYGIDAFLWVGTYGETGANAIGKVLTGKVNPSGKLPDTFWNYHYLNPVLANFAILVDGGSTATQWAQTTNLQTGKHIVYQEGIYMGYRYTETRYEDTVLKDKENVGSFDYYEAVSYPFGYGLSYTTFEYSNMTAKKITPAENSALSDTVYKVTVDVTNTGSVAGKESVQLYLQKPYTDYDKEKGIEKASAELVGFGKTKLLQPGETETITIQVNQREFASYDSYGAKTYIIDAGDYYLTAAKDSHAAVNNILAAKGKTTADGMTEEGNAALAQSFTLEFDAETYATSAVTGNAITNQFENADLKLYEGAGENKDKLRYITRSNWEGTVKLGLTKDNQRTNNYYKVITTAKMQEDLTWSWTYQVEAEAGEYPTYGSKETDYQLIDLRAYDDGDGDPTNDVAIPYDDPMWEDLLDQLTWDETVFLLSHALRKTSAIESIGKPETLDHNGGCGPNLPYNVFSNVNNGLAIRTADPDQREKPIVYPCNGLVAATYNLELSYEYGQQWGEDCLWAGYAGLYGMGLNTHRSAYGGRNFEYYSEDPVLMGKIAAEATKGMAEHGAYVYLKHCFLNDQETFRCGGWTWANEQTIREVYLKSFQIAIEEGGAQCVMGGLNSLGMEWTGVQGFMNTVLRGEFGMTGHAVTDSYDCYNGSFVKAVLYGNDLPDGSVLTEDETFEYAAPKYGKNYANLAWAMRESAHRVLYTVVHSNAMNGYDSTTKVIKITPAWVNLLEGGRVGSGIAVGVSVLLFAFATGLELTAKARKKKEEA